MNRLLLLLIIMFWLTANFALADQAQIRAAKLNKDGDTWTVYVTIFHADTGWDHYADGWRVLDHQGNELGRRTLYHPHVDEQPFTRSLSGVNIPSELKQVYIQAHDKVHGWNPDNYKVDLN